MAVKTINNVFVNKLKIEKLFGYYNYNIYSENHNSPYEKLLILYSDNGSGKTTILKAIFYLLSPQKYEGHKSKLGEIKFKSFHVGLSNGLEVRAERQESDTGSYQYIITHGDVVKSIYISIDESGSSPYKIGAPEEREYDSAMDYLKSMELEIHFLSDERTLINTNESPKELDYSLDDIISKSKSVKLFRGERQEKVVDAINVLANWINEKIIYYSNIGETNSGNVYIKLVKESTHEEIASDLTKENLLELVETLSDLINSYAEIGFGNKFDNDLIDAIKNTNEEDKIIYIYKVILPFIKASMARVETFRDLKALVDYFLNSINTYFQNKEISYYQKTGFKLKFADETNLSFENLSSGEKHLLLLFINTIIATDKAAIFIIDEPEISLNVKWQRMLLKTLLGLSKNSRIQFVIATHSIELVTPVKESIFRLTNDKGSVSDGGTR